MGRLHWASASSTHPGSLYGRHPPVKLLLRRRQPLLRLLPCQLVGVRLLSSSCALLLRRSQLGVAAAQLGLQSSKLLLKALQTSRCRLGVFGLD